MEDKCLICEEEKNMSNQKCKLCGMSTAINHYMNNQWTATAIGYSFIFCSEKCMNKFDEIFKMSSQEEKAELYKKEIII